MNRGLRRLVALSGLLVLGLAVALARGDFDGLLPVDRGVSLAGNDYFLVAGIAVLTLPMVVLVVVSGRPGRLQLTRMPDPEEPVTLPTPGDAFDQRTARPALPVLSNGRRHDVRERLRAAAVDVVARTDACSRSEAERRVDRGRWTSDPVAAGFVARSVASTPSTLGELRAVLGGETALRRRARRTVDGIVDCQRPRRSVTDGGRD